MTYALFRNIITKESFFSKWDSEKFGRLTPELMNSIYSKYVLKCNVFKRDNFVCRNTSCNSDSELTLHHIKWQKNGGKNTIENTVTVCDSCHKAFHRAKRPLIFPNVNTLPSHIRGHTFKVQVSEEVNWKILRKKLKSFRKTLKTECNYQITDEQMIQLFMFLFNYKY